MHAQEEPGGSVDAAHKSTSWCRSCGTVMPLPDPDFICWSCWRERWHVGDR